MTFFFHAKLWILSVRVWKHNPRSRDMFPSPAKFEMCMYTTSVGFQEYVNYLIFANVYEKTRHICKFMNFSSYIFNSSIIELTCVQVSDQSRTFAMELERLVCNHATPRQSRNYGLKALLCTLMAFPYTTLIPEVN